jgi:CSLREA domain-containing protein
MPKTRLVRTPRRTLVAVLGCALALVGGLLMTPASPVAAATLHVTSCADNGGATTLRGMIGSAGVGDTIVFDQDCTGATAITLTTGTLTLTQNVAINGTGHTVVVDGGCTFSGGVCTSGGVTVFTVYSFVTASISGLTIQHGNSATLGGGITNYGVLTVGQVTVQNNTGYSGGGIYSADTGVSFSSLVVQVSTIRGNTATASTAAVGGGIETANGGSLDLSGSTVSGNTAHNGGGIGTDGFTTITNSTISGNTANFPGGTGAGGGIRNSQVLMITNSTISGNQATGTVGGNGGGILYAGPSLTVTNSTISGNTATTGGGISNGFNHGTLTHVTIAANNTGIDAPSALTLANVILANTGANCTRGGPMDGKYNLISDSTCFLADATDIIGANPQLLPLGSYGGTTQTQPPKVGSPAINTIPASGANCTTPDQRGTTRPFGATCDMGAVEFAVALAPFSGTGLGGTTLTLTGYGLVAGMTVSLGGSACTGVNVNGAGTVATCTTGAHAAGAVDLTLTANSQSATFSGLYAYIAPVTVTTSSDTTNPCATSGTGTCSLRDAVTFANNNDSTPIAFNLPNPSTITLTGGTLALTRTTGSGTTITGPGTAALTVDGNCTLTGSVCTSGGATVFQVSSGVTASLSNLTIQHGNGSPTCGALPCGGGIANSGTLTVTNSTLSGNAAFSGGIFNFGTLTVTNSTLSANSATGNGGGIGNSGGTLTVTNSTLSANSATGGGGGGIDNGSGGTLTVTNSTLAGNVALIGGGLHNLGGTLTVTNSTLAGNSGGINNGGGPVTLTNTIVAASTSGRDLNGGGISGNHNLIDDTSAISGTGNLTNTPALLGPLGTYGSTNGTQTFALLSGSPAIDAGDDTICAGAAVGGKDQRGIARPQGAHCDIGAFEYPVPTLLPGAKPPGPAGGPPSPLPAVRPPGSPGGVAPNPLPAPRP